MSSLNEDQQRLVESVIHLARYFANRHKGPPFMEAEDYFAALMLAVVRAAPKFESTLGGWPNFAYGAMRNERSTMLAGAATKKRTAPKDSVDADDLLGGIPCGSPCPATRAEALDDHLGLTRALDRLERSDPTLHRVATLFMTGRKLRAIAQAMGSSKECARLRLQKSLRKLRGYLSSL